MKVIDIVESVLVSMDKALEPLPSHAMQMVINRALNGVEDLELSDEESRGVLAEYVAWTVATEAWNVEPWHAYFGPHSYGLRGGKPFYAPPIDQLDPTFHEHWVSRIGQFSHPVMNARYADLAWELSPHVGKIKPNYKHAIIAIDGYLESNSRGLTPEFHDQVAQASRALQLSRQLRDEDRSEAATKLLLALHNLAIGAEGFWWKTYDSLTADKKLTDERRTGLATSLETLAVTYSNISDPAAFDPFQLQTVSERLLAYYNRIGSRDDVIRVHEMVGRAFEHSATLGDSLRASSVLQDAENAYLDAGKPDDAKRVRNARIEAIKKSRDEMQSFEFTQTITRDEMDNFVARVVTDQPITTLVRVASQFVPEVAEVERQVKNVTEGSIAGFFPVAVMAADHQAAMLGGVEDDLDGHVVHHAQRNIQFHSPYLHRSLRVAIERHELDPYAIAGFADRSDLFDDLTFVLDGVGAWFGNDHMKAIHVLVPQVERALRAITGKLGEPTTRKHPTMPDREVALGMSEILGNKVVKEALGVDLTFFFKMIYSDPRGLNLRNSVAHGLLVRGLVNSVVSDLVIHTLLVFGLWDQLAAYRKKKAGES